MVSLSGNKRGQRRSWLEKRLGNKNPDTEVKIPKSGPKGSTKISAGKRTSSQRLAGSVRAREYKREKGKVESRVGKLASNPGSKDNSNFKTVGHKAAAQAVAKAEKAATARRRKRLADLKKRGVKPSNKFDLE